MGQDIDFRILSSEKESRVFPCIPTLKSENRAEQPQFLLQRDWFLTGLFFSKDLKKGYKKTP
jgi:hypothetical protein